MLATAAAAAAALFPFFGENGARRTVVGFL